MFVICTSIFDFVESSEFRDVFRRAYHSKTHTTQPLNLNFKDLNTTTLQKQHDIYDNPSILYNMGSF
jgi:hypothetical protein